MTQHDKGKHSEFAPTSRDEQEVTIRLDRVSGRAYICSCWPAVSRRLVTRYGPPLRISRDREGRITAAFWEVPCNLIVFRRPVTAPAPGSLDALRRAQDARRAAQEAASHERPE